MYWVHWNTRKARLARKSRADSRPATGRSWKPVRSAGAMGSGQGAGQVGRGGTAAGLANPRPSRPSGGRTLQEAGDVLQLGDVVRPVATGTFQQLESLLVLPAGVGGVEAPEGGVHFLPAGGRAGLRPHRVVPSGGRSALPPLASHQPLKPSATGRGLCLCFGGFQGTRSGWTALSSLGQPTRWPPLLPGLHLRPPGVPPPRSSVLLEVTALTHKVSEARPPGTPYPSLRPSPAAVTESHHVAISSAVYSTRGIGSPLRRDQRSI